MRRSVFLAEPSVLLVIFSPIFAVLHHWRTNKRTCSHASILLPSLFPICEVKNLNHSKDKPWDNSIWVSNSLWQILYAFTFKQESTVYMIKSDEDSILFPSPLNFHCVDFMFALEEIPLCSVIIHFRLRGLELFTSLIDSLIEVKLRHRCCRTIPICDWKTENIKCWYHTAIDESALLCNDITGTLTLQRTK